PQRLLTRRFTRSNSGQPPNVQALLSSTSPNAFQVEASLLNPCRKMTGTGGLASTGEADRIANALRRIDKKREVLLPKLGRCRSAAISPSARSATLAFAR